MTKLSRPVRREVASLPYGPLIVTLTEEGIYLREKGRRMSFLMPYGVAYREATLRVWRAAVYRKLDEQVRREDRRRSVRR